MKYLTDSSLGDSTHEPLREHDLDDSTGSYMPFVTGKRLSKEEPHSYTKKPELFGRERGTRNKELKEIQIHTEKLPVYHKGGHKEQFGTLIVRHHEHKDSKCIQCRNCGIFFTASTFLRHTHDEYGKRSQCNGAHLLLGLDCPTSQQQDAWNNFQRKMLSNGKEHSSVSSDIARLQKERWLDSSEARTRPMSLPHEILSNQRSRRASIDPPFQRPSAQLRLLSKTNEIDSQKKYNAVNWMSKSDKPINGFTTTTTKSISDAATNYSREPKSWLWDEPEPARTLTESLTGLARNTNTPPWEVPSRNGGDSDPFGTALKPPANGHSIGDPMVSSSSISDNSSIDRAFPLEKPSTDTISDDDRAENIIKTAISMLKKASQKITSESGNNSNAWRKMYEEERDHRMKLEAKVRYLEREVRSSHHNSSIKL